MTIETDVLIIGAGPTGLMLGCELRRCGIDCVVVDRSARIDRRTRAVMVHAASLEQLEQLGLRTKIERKGVRQRRIVFHLHHSAHYTIDFSSLDTRYPYYLNVPQPEVEEVLAAEFKKLGGTLVRGLGYVSHQETGNGVSSDLASAIGPVRIDSQYLVGADGAGSTVRTGLGVEFPGVTYPMSYLLAEGQPVVPPPPDSSAMYVGRSGSVSLLPLPGGTIRVAGPVSSELLDRDETLPLERFQDTVDRLGFGNTLRLAHADRVAQYQVHERLADRFRVGRVLLAGDAAHLNSPAGGQAMNTGFGDAAALAWRLGQLVRDSNLGIDLLDGYAHERRATARAVARSTGDLGVLQSMREATSGAEQALVRARLSGLAEAWSQLYLTYPAATSPTGEAQLFRGPHRIRPGARIPGLRPVAGLFTLLVRPGQVADALRNASRLPVGAHIDELTPQQASWLPAGATAALVRPDRHVAVVLPQLTTTTQRQAIAGLREEVPA